MESAAQSYAAWWHEAGLHTAIDEAAHGWLGEQPVPFWRREAPVAQVRVAQPHAETVAPARAASAPVARAPASSTTIPSSLPAFLDWLAQDSAQPEASWDGALILPPAQHAVRLLVIVEMPAPGADNADSLLEAGQRRFIDAMLASLGVPLGDTALTAMAMRRPPGGVLDEETLTQLAARMTHYLGLARPEAAIILGDRTNRALLGTQWNPRAAGLPQVNHPSGRMRAVALPNLDLLMARPMAKAKSWQALRLLNEAINA